MNSTSDPIMWIDLLDNKKIISSIFGDEVPNLNSFKVKKLEVDQLGNAIKLTGDLSSYPSCPPKKWVVQKFNTVNVVLEFFNVYGFELGAFDKLNIVDIDIYKNDKGIICITSSGLVCKSEIFDLMVISGYQDTQS